MKKIISLALALVMLVSLVALTSCKSDEVKKLDGKTAEVVYTRAVEALKDKDNYTLTIAQRITMTLDGEEQTLNQSVTSKFDGNNVYINIQNDTDEGINVEMWYLDEVYYLIQGTTKVKASISYDKYLDKYMPEGVGADSALATLPDTWFKDTGFHRDDDKDMFYIEFVIGAEEYDEYFKTLSMGVDVSIADVTYRVYFDSKARLGDIEMELDCTVAGVAAHMVTTMKIKDAGTTKIAPPQGTDGWSDLTGIL